MARTGSEPASEPGPVYQRIAAALRLIVLRSDDISVRLPTESELAEEHGVSRQTVRRAYQELVADGLVKRIPGRGTFAVNAGSQYLRRFGTVEDLMSLSVDTEMEVLSPLRLRVEIEAAGRLGLSTDVTATISFRRLHLGVPFCVTDVYLPADISRLLSDVPDSRRGHAAREPSSGYSTRLWRSRSAVRTRRSRLPSLTAGWLRRPNARSASRCCASTGSIGRSAGMPSNSPCRVSSPRGTATAPACAAPAPDRSRGCGRTVRGASHHVSLITAVWAGHDGIDPSDV